MNRTRATSAVRACALPDDALLQRYARRGHTDCYTAQVPISVSQAGYVAAFYTAALFKAERLVLAALSMPSTDAQVSELAEGTRDAFAAWTVEARTPDQLLLCDVNRATRSWLMTAPSSQGGTRLYFGSAVVAKVDADSGQVRLRAPYRALLGFHRLYSRALLSAARRRLLARGS